MMSSKHNFWSTQEYFPTSCFAVCFVRPEKFCDALYVAGLGRARGLSDLMAEKYSVEMHISADPKSWFGIENIFKKKNDCTCLYISYFHSHLHLWILKTSGVLHYKKISLEENLVQAGLPKDLPLSEFLAENFRSLGICPLEIVRIGL